MNLSTRVVMPLPRAIPPTAVPLRLRDLAAGCTALLRGGEAEQESFRRELGHYLGVPHVFLASSGKAALVRLLLAMARLRPGKSEVLLPAYTSFSVPSAVVRAGLKVTLYDLDPETLSPDLDSLSQAVNSETLCVVVCHLFGYPTDLDSVRMAWGNFTPFLIDDAAQALGARYQGRLVGTCGDAGLFSLSRGKPLSAIEGGIVVTASAELATALEAIALAPLAWHQPWLLAIKGLAIALLQNPEIYWIPRRLTFLRIGESFFTPDFPVQRISPLQALLARRMLARIEIINRGRRSLAEEMVARLREMAGVKTIRTLAAAEPVYLRLPILSAHLPLAAELGVVASYPLPLDALVDLQPEIAGRSRAYPGAARLAAQLRTLPTHSYVTPADIESIMATLQSVAVAGEEVAKG